jgi:plastocyanin
VSTTAYLLAALSGTAFYVLGSCLTALALVVTAIGLRSSERFPTKLATRVGIALFAVLVVGTGFFAVAYSEDEQEHREAELAAEEAQEGGTELPGGGEVPTPDAGEAEGTPPGQETSPPTQPAVGPGQGGGAGERQEKQQQQKKASSGGPGGMLALAADPTQIAYDKTSLTSKPGEVTIDFDNPSQVGHDVAIEQGSKEIAKTPVITDSEASVSAELQPGSYVFFCTVPGHREAGMQGTLTVK